MCDFFSCIVKKNKEVLYLPDSSHHIDILEHFKIPDRTDDPNRLGFARVEILPVAGIRAPIEAWEFKIDERIHPEWWSPAHEEAARAALAAELAVRLPSDPPTPRFAVGKQVRVVKATDGWGNVRRGDVGVVRSVFESSRWSVESLEGLVLASHKYYADFPRQRGWAGLECCFEEVEES